MVRPVIRVPAYEEAFGGPASFGHNHHGGDAAAVSQHGKRGAFSKVPSLLFDLEDLEEGCGHKPSPEHPTDAALLAVRSQLSALLEPWTEAEYMLLVHVRLAREEAGQRGCPLALGDLANTLRRLGYSVKIRTALGGGWGGACLRNLRHTFLTLSLPGKGGTPVQYILDAKFREQFEVAHPTSRYARVMEAVGQEILATPERLTKVVELLCAEMARCFAEMGTPLPPWRQAAAMLSKWQPRRSEDTDVLPCPASLLNNSLGMMSAAGAGEALGLPPRPRAGGAPTVAQRMAALGPPVQASAPSPIAEDAVMVGASPLSATPNSAGSSLGSGSVHVVGWPEGELEEEEACGPHASARVVPMPCGAEPAAAAARLLSSPLAAGKPAAAAAWEGMKRAAAALPPPHTAWT